MLKPATIGYFEGMGVDTLENLMFGEVNRRQFNRLLLNSNLNGITFNSCHFYLTTLSKFKIEGCNFNDCYFLGTKFSEVQFYCCDFKDCFLSMCKFKDCKFLNCSYGGMPLVKENPFISFDTPKLGYTLVCFLESGRIYIENDIFKGNLEDFEHLHQEYENLANLIRIS